MKIQASELHRLLYNAILFTDKKSAAGGVAAFRVSEHGLGVMATDDHVAILDVALAPNDDAPEDLFLSLETMKALEKDLRDQNSEIDFAGDPHRILGAADPGFWDAVGRMLSLDEFVSDDSLQHVTFGLNPDRLRKFSLLKPGGYPIDMRYGYDRGVAREVIAFKAGPTLRGVLAPLDRRLLKEKYGPEAGSVMW